MNCVVCNKNLGETPCFVLTASLSIYAMVPGFGANSPLQRHIRTGICSDCNRSYIDRVGMIGNMMKEQIHNIGEELKSIVGGS